MTMDANRPVKNEKRKRRRNGFAGKVWALHMARFDPVRDPYKALSLRNFRFCWGGSSSVICAIGVWALHMATDRPVLRTRRTTLFDNCFHRMHSGNRVLKSAAWFPAKLCMRARGTRSPQLWTRALTGSRGASTGVWNAGKPWRGPLTWSLGTLFLSPNLVYHHSLILQRLFLKKATIFVDQKQVH